VRRRVTGARLLCDGSERRRRTERHHSRRAGPGCGACAKHADDHELGPPIRRRGRSSRRHRAFTTLTSIRTSQTKTRWSSAPGQTGFHARRASPAAPFRFCAARGRRAMFTSNAQHCMTARQGNNAQRRWGSFRQRASASAWSGETFRRVPGSFTYHTGRHHTRCHTPNPHPVASPHSHAVHLPSTFRLPPIPRLNGEPAATPNTYTSTPAARRPPQPWRSTPSSTTRSRR
jgi:hypothetical protein